LEWLEADVETLIEEHTNSGALPNSGVVYRNGDGERKDRAQAWAYLKKFGFGGRATATSPAMQKV